MKSPLCYFSNRGKISIGCWSRCFTIDGDAPRDEVDFFRLEVGPVVFFDLRSRFCELVGGKLATPVGLNGLLDLTVGTCAKMNDNASKTPHEHVPIRGKPRTLERTILNSVGVGKGKERIYGTVAPLRF